MKQHRLLMKASVDMLSSISIWIALNLKHVKMVYLLCSFQPCLVKKKPKQSIPQYVNGGDGLVRSEGRLAILCSSVGLSTCHTVMYMVRHCSADSWNPVALWSDLINCESLPLMLDILMTLRDDRLCYMVIFRKDYWVCIAKTSSHLVSRFRKAPRWCSLLLGDSWARLFNNLISFT